MAEPDYKDFQNPPSPYRGIQEPSAAAATADSDAAAIRRGSFDTLNKSARVARSFLRTLGGMGPRGHQPTVLSDLYWFAKLYELITYREIELVRSSKLRHPRFLLLFIPTFYDMYFDALENYLSNRRDEVSARWLLHFGNCSGAASSKATSLADWQASVTLSIVTGVSAHIEGDMSSALVTAYNAYVTKSPRRSLDEFHNDFFDVNRPVFEQVQTDMFTELAKLSPLPLSIDDARRMIGIGAKVFGGLDIDEVFGWRGAAWNKAKTALGQS